MEKMLTELNAACKARNLYVPHSPIFTVKCQSTNVSYLQAPLPTRARGGAQYQAAKASESDTSPTSSSTYAPIPPTPSYPTYASVTQPKSSASVSTLSSYHDHDPPTSLTFPPSATISNPPNSIFPLLNVEPAASTSNHKSLDAVLPRALRLEILSLFYRCVYPLMPVPHKTTFMADIHSRREELAGQGEWIAMVFSILAFTLVQMPHHLVSITKNEIRELVEKLSHKVKLCLLEDHHTISLERMITVYCIGTVHNNLGRHMQSRALHGSNVVHCLQLGLNEESTYASMDPITAESYRRLFWAIYCSDRSAACSENGNLLFNEDEINVAFPKDLDDQFITRSAFHEPPIGHASIMRGFTESCRLFSMGGNMLSKRMHDRSRPPSGYALRGRINELDDILQGIESLLLDCQPEMRLGWTDMGLLATHLEGGFADAVPDMLRDLITTSHADSTPFLVHTIIPVLDLAVSGRSIPDPLSRAAEACSHTACFTTISATIRGTQQAKGLGRSASDITWNTIRNSRYQLVPRHQQDPFGLGIPAHKSFSSSRVRAEQRISTGRSEYGVAMRLPSSDGHYRTHVFVGG
uniref:Xylanolytic transcriptional activator regulatory domain-containing protein n=1 Tax=Kwoniella pini CBS 10737 TaxID=1296096 RepID=A0A1B9I014_9TREE|nr:uncharacterized protein I206_04566 [Kwoniella pini CBS 10737]OCF48879.1 hypothetical protein I206_04566 [Kwoniella pini CBS 10737]